MEHLKCYGAQEMVRLSLLLDRKSSLVNGQPVPERPSLRKSFIELRVGSWLIVEYTLKINCCQPPPDTLRGKRLGGDNIHLL